MLGRFRNKGPLISANCTHPALRMLMLMGVFAMTATAYWWHFEKRMAEILPPSGEYTIINEDDILAKDELKKLYTWRDAFKEEWGLQILVKASAGELTVPEFSGSTLFVGIGLLHKQATIIFPPLAKKALGEGLRTITEENLALCIKDNSAATCLDSAMQALWDGF